MRKIILCAGHSDNQEGAIGIGGVKESKLTKRDRDGVKYFLDKNHPEIEVLVDDNSKSLSQVISWIKQEESKSPCIVCDFHYNAGGNGATGVEVFVSDKASKTSKAIAQEVQDVIVKITGLRDRGVKPESLTVRKKIGILNTNSPAILIEMGFITNEKDMELIEKWKEWVYEEIAFILAKYARK